MVLRYRTPPSRYELFNQVGPVASIRVCRDKITKKSLGYGYVTQTSNFGGSAQCVKCGISLPASSIDMLDWICAKVNFHNVKDAETALDSLSYTSIHGRSCRLMWSDSVLRP